MNTHQFGINIKIFVLTSMVFLSSCNPIPYWIKEELGEKDFSPELIDYQKGQLNDKPLFFSSNEVVKHYGNPLRRIDSCYNFYINKMLDSKSLDCLIYDSLWSLVIKETREYAFVSGYDFSVHNDTIKISEIDLSSSTHLKEIRKLFPTSYKWMNFGLGNLEHKYPYWIYLGIKEDMKNKPHGDYIQLFFNKNKTLERLEYIWFPVLNNEELIIYKKEKM